MKHGGDGDANLISEPGTVPKVLKESLKEVEFRGRIETMQNSEKNPGDRRGFAVTQTPVKDL